MLIGVNKMNEKTVWTLPMYGDYMRMEKALYQLAMDAVSKAFSIDVDPDSEFLDRYVVVTNLENYFFGENYPKYIVVERGYAELVAVAFTAISFSDFKDVYEEAYPSMNEEDAEIAFLESDAPKFYNDGTEYESVRNFFFEPYGEFEYISQDKIDDLIFENLRFAKIQLQHTIERSF